MKEIIQNQYLQLLIIIATLFPFLLFFYKVGAKWFKVLKRMRIMKCQANYYKELDSDEFIQWRNLQLSKIYGKGYFTDVLGTEYPVFGIQFSDYFKYSEFKTKNVYSKDDVCQENYSIKDGCIVFPSYENTSIMTSGTKKDVKQKRKLLKQYRRILTGSIKAPKLAGFSLDHYDFDDKQNITHIYPKLGTYEYNVYSSHILEYEMFMAYKQLKGNKDVSVETLWAYLPFRRHIHGDSSVEDVLLSGIRRFSLFSVQCIVVFMDKNQKDYMTLLMKRSTDPDKISAKLGYFQFLPAGGFELYEKEQIHSLEMIKDNYSLRKAIFREYLEEVFDEKDFKTVVPTTNSETTHRILSHPKIIQILDLIENGKASFNLLGVVVDLVTLRHEISFVLKIDDESYSLENFCPNDEFTRDNSSSKVRISLKDAEKLLSNQANKHKFNQASALLYKMFMESPFYPQS